MSERLRLEAEFRDRGVASGLRKISGELKEVRRTPGMEQAHEWMEKFTDRSKDFVKEGGGVGGVLKGIGLGGLLASTSLSELIASFKELGQRAADMKEVARQTGLTIDQVNQLQKAGEALHIDPSKMTAGLEHLSSQMFDFKRHMGELWGQLNQEGYGAFAHKLELDKPLEQVQDIAKFLAQIRDPQLQKRWTELFLGDGDLSRLLTHGGRDFADAIKEAEESTAKITPELLKQQAEFSKSIREFNDSWENFQTEVGPFVFEELNKALGDFRDLFGQIKQAYDWFQEAKKDPAGAAKQLGDAADKAFNDKAKEVGDSWRGTVTSSHGEDSNALRRNDETLPVQRQRWSDPVPPKTDGNALRRSDETPADPFHYPFGLKGPRVLEGIEEPANPLLHRSSFTTGGGSSFGLAEIITQGTKAGTLAAFRELLQQSDADKQGNGGIPGLQNASYETPGPAAGRSLGDGPRTGGPTDSPGGSFKAGDGAMAAKAKESYDFWRSKGLNHNAALAMVAQEQGETGFNPRPGDYVNGRPTAFGSFQLHDDRGRLVRQGTGIDVHDPNLTHQQQLEAAWFDGTKGGRAGFFDRLNRVGGRDASSDYATKFFEGPLNLRKDQAIRRGIAGQWDGGDKMVDRSLDDRPQGLASQAVDNASKLLGMGSSQAARALGARMTPGEWCADFVNGALKSSNVRGVNSSIATSFLGWGKEVAAETVRKGDVLVEDRGRGLGSTGGHVGFATGRTRTRNGRVEDEMLSGNHGDRVGLGWVPAGSVHARRQMNLPEAAAKAGVGEQTIRHEGGAALDISIRGDGSVGPVRSRSHGMITAVNLSRGPTMISAAG